MTSLALAVALQASMMGANSQGAFANYEEAFQGSIDTGRPLVVLLGADWCPACVKMKNTILPEVHQAGGLAGINMTYVDVDRDPRLASQLARGSSIPQLIRFERRGTQWESQLLTGAHSPRKVAAFIQGGPDENKTPAGWGARLSSWAEVITGGHGR